MSEIAATNAMTVSARPVGGGTGLAGLTGTVKSFAGQPAVAKSLPLIGLVALLGLAAMVWAAIATPPGRELFSGLSESDKGAVASALDTAGIQYQVDSGSGALSVGEDDYHKARMLLAAQGLPKSAPQGNDLIADLPLGASRAVEGERLRGAKEMDLARTIETIDAVESARVHLAVEAPSVFLRDRVKRGASVMLRLQGGRQLGDSQVQAIVNLVASSVSGLAPEGVSVVDQNGRLLSNGQGDASSAASERQIATQAKIEANYLDALTTLLTPIVGAGNFTAEVSADVDFSETQATREGFPQEASTIAREERAWTSAGGDAEASGIPGALSNQAPTATQVAAAPGQALDPATPGATPAESAAKTQENYTRNFAIGREVSVTRQPVGQVKRLSVAVALKTPEGGKALTRAELAEIEKLVKGAVGFSQARGDVVALSSRKFATVEEATAAWYEAGWVGMVTRNVTALLAVLILVFGIGRPLMKRRAVAKEREVAAKTGGEIAAALASREGDSSSSDITLNMIEAAPSYEARAVLIRNFVRQDPARAALVVRDLLRTNSAEGVEKNG